MRKLLNWLSLVTGISFNRSFKVLLPLRKYRIEASTTVWQNHHYNRGTCLGGFIEEEEC